MYFFAVRLTVSVMHSSFSFIVSPYILSGLFLRACAVTRHLNSVIKFAMIRHFFRFNVSKQFIRTRSPVHNFLHTFEASSLKYTTHDIIANTTIYFFSDIWCILRTQLPYTSFPSTIFLHGEHTIYYLLSPPTVRGFFSDDNCTFQKNRIALLSKGPITQFQ